ncbi:ferredoxin/adrenodoxin, putative [Theileria equi strain WA]|uniref:Ferredoxin/adrenodoxin, putative n=1 Tax=Theileria equi strain WA TaxID=1537102 RepID=L0AYY5_THEEQ|nr:ferredoxin/adrenodoxin, putative [Theileria equi strain WA]AFZ80443.1 ferredoxin/adrenodoxin, putative [Theileria equi strain WA]|eukprot:XP_004830109.1 ferredoxin/adrenodoxin, putative [Theileria equi strain WA]
MRFLVNLLQRIPLRNLGSRPALPKNGSHRRFLTTSSNDTVSVVFVQHDEEIDVTVPVGTNILEAAHQNNIELEGACDGCMACSTCHVILEDHVYDSLPEPSEAEMDMLDLAPCLTETSRLGCQVVLQKEHEGIKIQLPRITRNFYVDGHVPAPH